MNKKTLIIAGILVALAIVLFILTGTMNKPADNTPADNTTPEETVTTNPTDIATFPLDETKVSALATQAQSEYDFAFSKAKEWKSDVAPVAVLIKYTGSINDANGKNTYIFASPSLSQYYFTLVFDQAINASGQNNFQRVLNFKEDYFLPINTAVLPVNYYKLNYLDALRQADDLGGKNIRAGNPVYDVNMVLSAQTGGFLMWDIEYTVNGSVLFNVSINAYDGTVTQ